MKQILQVAGFVIAIFLTIYGLVYLTTPTSLPGYHVEQTIRKSCGETNLVTYVWHNGEIVESWYDEISTINDSTKIKRRAQAKQLVENLKK